MSPCIHLGGSALSIRYRQLRRVRILPWFTHRTLSIQVYPSHAQQSDCQDGLKEAEEASTSSRAQNRYSADLSWRSFHAIRIQRNVHWHHRCVYCYRQRFQHGNSKHCRRRRNRCKISRVEPSSLHLPQPRSIDLSLCGFLSALSGRVLQR